MANSAVSLSELHTWTAGSAGKILSIIDRDPGSGTLLQMNWIDPPAGTIADDSITEAKLDIHDDPASGNVLGYTSNGMEWISPGTASVTDGRITTDKLANNAVTLAKLNTTSAGSAGNVLSRTATGLNWIAAASGGDSLTSITWAPTVSVSGAASRAGTSGTFRAARIGNFVMFTAAISINITTANSQVGVDFSLPYNTQTSARSTPFVFSDIRTFAVITPWIASVDTSGTQAVIRFVSSTTLTNRSIVITGGYLAA